MTRSSILAACLPALLVIAVGRPAAAQANATATGTVIDAVTGDPIRDVHITVAGTDLSVRTDREGKYRIERLPDGELLVRLTAKGYTDQVEKIVVYAGWTTSIDFELTPLIAMLDALSVDVIGARRAVNTVTGADAAGRGGFEALAERLPGVQVLRPGTGVGGAARILIRGLKSLMPNEPAIYVDGVRIFSGGYGQLERGLAPGVSPLDSIDPESIERIEILRGPATAVRYGLDAADGVILIYTKRGGGR